MDHEQTFCSSEFIDCCPSDHWSVDFTAYIVYEAQALALMAKQLGLHDRMSFWDAVAINTTDAMDALMWDPKTQFYYDRYFNGSLMNIKTVAGFYPLMIDGVRPDRVEGMLKMMKTPEFWTAVPLPTVSTDTVGFSSDLDRGPMWEQQNFYIIRGLRKQGYHTEANALKAASLAVVKHYYQRWGVVFEYYDAVNRTDPTQTLRKPTKGAKGQCKPGVPGIQGQCGSGGIRDYNFCAGLALLWLRGGE